MADLFLTPDLKWANRTRMLDPTYNSAVIELDTGTLDVTTDEDIGYVSCLYRVITLGPTKYKLGETTVRNLPGNNITYYYGIGDGVIRSFILRKSTGSV